MKHVIYIKCNLIKLRSVSLGKKALPALIDVVFKACKHLPSCSHALKGLVLFYSAEFSEVEIKAFLIEKLFTEYFYKILFLNKGRKDDINK